MATTLLLAYSGGYLTLLMLFQVKAPGIMRMLNLKIVAAEIMQTLVTPYVITYCQYAM